MSESNSLLTGELTAGMNTPGIDAKPSTGSSNGSEMRPEEQIEQLLNQELATKDEEKNDEQETDQGGDDLHEPGRSRGDEERRDESPGEQEPERAESEQELGEESEQGLTTLADAAKALGTNARGMYNLQIPMGNGESKSLGELKDAFRRDEEWQADIATRENALTDREVMIQTANQDLAYLQNEIAEHISPQRLQQLQQRRMEQARLETGMLHQAIPEMADHNYYEKWRGDAQEWLGKFGFHPQELVVTDHRLLLVLDHAMKLEKRWHKLGEVKLERAEPAPKPSRKRKVSKPSPRSGPRGNTRREDQISQVSNILSGALK